MPAAESSWSLVHLPITSLLLDTQNARFPELYELDAMSQDQISVLIDKHYDPIQIARSIARHGYFESEPLIAIATQSEGNFIVVEGNRRLTALKALASPELRALLTRQTKAWSSLPTDIELPTEIPVVVVQDRQVVVPLLGFRHISGIEPWEPISQARFIARLVADGQSLEEISELVGRPLTEVRSMYRDHEVLRQASSEFKLDTTRAEENFGVFTAAMGRTKIRDYIQAPAPREVDPEYWPLPEDSAPNMQRLLTYVFGNAGGKGRVVTDSRQLKDLGEVLSDPTGVAEAIMVETKSISEAVHSMRAKGQQFETFIRSAERALSSARNLEVRAIDGSVRNRLIIIQSIVAELAALPTLDSSGDE
jgi:hypothetical protein